MLPSGPRVPARKEGVSFAIFLSAWPSSLTSAVSCSGSLENTRWEEGVRHPYPRPTSPVQDPAAVIQELLGGRQMHLPQFGVAEGHDGAFAAGIHHHGRD